MSSPEQIGGWFAAAGGGAIIVETVKALVQRGRMDADAAKTITEAATSLLAPLQKRAEDLERQVSDLQTRLAGTNEALRETMDKLQAANWELDRLRRRVQRNTDALDPHDDEDPTRGP